MRNSVVFLLLVALVTVSAQLVYPNIIIDPFDNPIGTTFQENVTCGVNGDACNLKQTSNLIRTFTQPGPWAPGQEPLGGERYMVMTIDQIQAGYEAGSADQVELTFDLPYKVRFAVSPSIGGSLMMLWNGPGNNVLPCISQMGAQCALDAPCCTGGGNPAGSFSGHPFANPDGSLDLTANGTQLGFTIIQNSVDHPSPVILRIFQADGRSIVLRKYFEYEFEQRTILFLYRDFVPFEADSPKLTKADVLKVLTNARAIVFQLYGAVALDARMTGIQTVGVQTSKKLDAEYVDKLFRPGDRVCWTAFLANNAPASLNPPGSDENNVFYLYDVDFQDYLFWNSPLHLDRSSITVTPNRADLVYDTHENDPTLDGDYLLISFPELRPSDNVTMHFCAVVRNDYPSNDCFKTFCNYATVNIPLYEVKDLHTETTCIDIKYSPQLSLTSQCPSKVTGSETVYATFGYSNTGNGPAENSVLRLKIYAGDSFDELNGLSENSAWTCTPDDEDKYLECYMNLGKILPGSSGTKQFALDLSRLGCDVNSIHIDATLTETCSNLTVISACDIPIPRSVIFSITKYDSAAGGGIKAKQQITYTINYQNTGNFRADGVYLVEKYDSTYSSPVTSANPGWICDAVKKECTYLVGSLEPGVMKTIQFTVVLVDTLPISLTQICNTVVITNKNESMGTGRCFNEMTTTKCTSVTPGVPETGIKKQGFVGLLVYRITYFNNGTADAQNAILRETIPAGTNFVAEESDSRWVCVGGTCTINLGVLPIGARASAIFAVAPVENFETTVTGCWLNRATIEHTATVPDQSPLDNVAALDLGNCNMTMGPIKCPLPCAKCPDQECKPPACDCPVRSCTCPVQSCPRCPDGNCDCDATCDCPPLKPCICQDVKCACENPCPVIEECEVEEMKCEPEVHHTY